MKMKSALLVSAIVALSGSNFGLSHAALADDSAAPVVTTQTPVATTAAVVQPKGEALLKNFLDEVMQSKTEMTHLTPVLRVNLNQRTGMIPALSNRLQSLGPMTSMTFVGVQNGMEIYDVRFTKGSSVWGVVAGMDGQLNGIRWKFQ